MEELFSSVPFPLSVLECTKVMQISFEKIVASKQQRGGARLHRNLMVLHVLQRARDQARQRYFSAFSLISPASDEDEEETSFTNDEDEKPPMLYVQEENSFTNDDQEKPPMLYVQDEKPSMLYVHDDPLPLEPDHSDILSSTAGEGADKAPDQFLLDDQIEKQNEENFSSNFYSETTEEFMEISKISNVCTEFYSSTENHSIFGEELNPSAVEVEEIIIRESSSSSSSGSSNGTFSSSRKRKTPEPPVGIEEEFFDAEEKDQKEMKDSGEDFTDCFIMKKKACLESSAKFSSSPISNFINLVGLNLNSNSDAGISDEKENSGGNSAAKNSCKDLPRSMTWPLADIACWS